MKSSKTMYGKMKLSFLEVFSKLKDRWDMNELAWRHWEGESWI